MYYGGRTLSRLQSGGYINVRRVKAEYSTYKEPDEDCRATYFVHSLFSLVVNR